MTGKKRGRFAAARRSPSGTTRTARQRIGYAATHEAALAAFAKSWRRE